MNIVIIRHLLKPICDHVWPRRNIHLAPLFVWKSRAASLENYTSAGFDSEPVRQMIYTPEHLAQSGLVVRGPNGEILDDSKLSGPPPPMLRLPYEAFFLLITGENGYKDELWLVVKNPDVPAPDFIRYIDIEGDFGEVAFSLSAKLVSKGANSNRMTYTMEIWDLKAGKPVEDAWRYNSLATEMHRSVVSGMPESSEMKIPPVTNPQWPIMWRVLAAMQLRPFLFELYHPGNYVVQVQPRAPAGKSVEWVKARTHLLIMDRKSMAHVAKAPTKASIPKLTPETERKQITRAAHDRMAHDRTLRAARFGKNIGKVIRVNAAWIGPKEWEGTDQKIYMVLSKKPGASV